MTGWTVKETYKMMQNPANEDEYMVKATLLLGDEFKIVKSDGAEIADWYPTGMGNNYIMAASGEYTVYFRPDGQGGTGWHEGYIYTERKDLGPWGAYFFDESLNPDYDSYITYDASAGKVTVNIRAEHYPASTMLECAQMLPEDGKCYRVAVNMKSNRDMTGVSLIWRNGTQTLLAEEGTISLAANDVFVYEAVCTAIADPANNEGSTLYVGFDDVHPGDIIEIYGVTIEETECPEPEKYYLVGTFNEWAATPDYLMAENAAAAGEYMLDTKLTEGDELKVVGISGEDENYYPAGLGNNYIVDAAHAGWVTVYFRPEGNAEWAEFGGYFYINVRQGIENVQGDKVQCTKVVENGHLMILKNGMKYNAQGALVK